MRVMVILECCVGWSITGVCCELGCYWENEGKNCPSPSLRRQFVFIEGGRERGRSGGEPDKQLA